MNRIALGKDGSFYIGMIGTLYCSCWTTAGGKIFGLQRLKPKGNDVFDFVALRSKSNTQFELEFSHPLAANAADIGKYAVKSWNYEPTIEYGGPKKNQEDIGVQSATLSADGKKVTLALQGLKTNRVIHIRVRDVLSTKGESPVANETYYTLNAFGPGVDPALPTSLAKLSSQNISLRKYAWGRGLPKLFGKKGYPINGKKRERVFEMGAIR